jgi:Sec-independent protein secretion pathway component TatC
LVIALASAVAAPPDALSMLIFMVPMVALYFISIGVSAIVVRKKERQLAAAAEAR